MRKSGSNRQSKNYHKDSVERIVSISFAYTRRHLEPDILNQYKEEGFNIRLFNQTLGLEQRMMMAMDPPSIYETLLLAHMGRQGLTDWPAILNSRSLFPWTRA